jgi:ornithine cyclodeaminase/alanine dehydrogenase-like protein (mu-crystallin family)
MTRVRGRTSVEDTALKFEIAAAESISPEARSRKGGDRPEQRITELGAVLRGTEAGRATQDPITAFDSSGFAPQDLALAQAILDRVQTDSDRTMETR